MKNYKVTCYWGLNLEWGSKWSIQYKPVGGMVHMKRLELVVSLVRKTTLISIDMEATPDLKEYSGHRGVR